MARLILTYVVPLVLPTLVYVLWHLVLVRKQSSTGNSDDVATESPWRGAPWHWLGLAGLALMGLSLVLFAELTGAPPGSVYEPARSIDGKVVPGQSTPPGTRQ
ncbi:MAG: hypothetical protein FJX57_25380 [Alphaproteobacteria bacterium]|nr:hypothetical protein [Alphaproteobacteria bacterium]